jgi:hypothetical protein
LIADWSGIGLATRPVCKPGTPVTKAATTADINTAWETLNTTLSCFVTRAAQSPERFLIIAVTVGMRRHQRRAGNHNSRGCDFNETFLF